MTSHSRPPEPIAARLLFLSASANRQTPLAVDREYNRVKTGLQTLGVWSAWRTAVEHVPAVTWEQVPEQLLLHRASIVHFAGHGHPDGSLEFSTREGMPQRIRPEGLAKLFGSHVPQIRLVVLNACYSDTLADALIQHVDVVVGMTHAIDDDTAIQFAPAFYQQLAGGTSVQTAFEVAHGVLLGQGPDAGALGGAVSRDLGDEEPPQEPAGEDGLLRVRVRAGVDASRMIFTAGVPGGRRRRAALWAGAATLALALAGLGLSRAFAPPPPLTADKLVIRVHEPGHAGTPAHVAGLVTLRGPDTGDRSRPLVDGEAVFDDMPAGSVGRSVEVSIKGVDGFHPTSERRVVPETRVVSIALTRAQTATPVTGSVVDAKSQPIAGAAINFENGLVLTETDARGDFRVVVPLPPGTMVTVSVAVNGIVGYRDNVTIPGPFPLQWVPP